MAKKRSLKWKELTEMQTKKTNEAPSAAVADHAGGTGFPERQRCCKSSSAFSLSLSPSSRPSTAPSQQRRTATAESAAREKRYAGE